MTRAQPMKIALVGCGFVADYYMSTLSNYPQLKLVGVYDKDPERLQAFTRFHNLQAYASLTNLLADEQVQLVVNLTNPRSHYEVNKTCLEHGKHVYSEKPLAMEYQQALELVELAEHKGLGLSSAPCSLLSEAAQTLLHAVRSEVAGKTRLVYAELDDGLLHRMAYKKWTSASGAPWPYKDEFEVGCTLEHAGYYLTWLVAMFGRVVSVTAFATCLIPDKVIGESLSPPDTPDCSIGVLVFESGVVARLTTTIIGPHDHSIRIIGDKGVISLKDCWLNDARVYVHPLITFRRKTFLSPFGRRYKAPGVVKRSIKDTGSSRMDYAGGIADLAISINQNTTAKLSARFALHVTEVALALHGATESGFFYATQSDPNVN